MGIRVFKDFDALPELKERWGELVACAPIQTVFQSYGWNRAWWEAFGESKELYLLVAEEDEKLVGLAPFCISTDKLNGLALKTLSFIGSTNRASDFCDWIVPAHRPDIVDEFLSHLYLERGAWHLVRFMHVPEESPHLKSITALNEYPGWKRVSRQCSRAPFRELINDADNRALVARKSFKRRLNALSKLGEVSFKELTRREEIELHLETFFNQHIARWENTDSPSLFLDPQQRQFYRILVRDLSSSETIRFAVLSIDGKPAAFHFGTFYCGRYMWYKPTFDPALARYSPGEVLLRFLFERALELGAREFDFGAGTENFKYRFSQTERALGDHQIYSKPVPFLLAKARQAASRIKQNAAKK